MKKTYTALLVFACLLSACDSGLDSETDDDLVTVRYAISSATNGEAMVLFLDENQEYASAQTVVGDGWEYTFKTEHGSQVLYLMTSLVLSGSVEAKIYVDDELQASHVHRTPTSTVTQRLASSAWGRNNNIRLRYNVDGAFIEDISWNVPAGIENISAADQGHYSYCAVDREMSISAGFEASITVSRDAVDRLHCADAIISYEPKDGFEYPLILASVQQCDVNPLNLSIALPVPGF